MTHEHYMDRCLQLAEMGRGMVSPNPLVGCVIVHDDRIIGEGFHAMYGGPHAEVNAINDVKDKNLLWESTLYVSLEPCSHYGKTPPCADLILQMNIPRVVICNNDPNPLVGGDGIRRLKDSGVEVITGVAESKGKEVNRNFFKAMEQGIPYITLKWAMTSDGYMGRPVGSSDEKGISGAYSNKLVHKLRAEADAILIGSGTLKDDDPLLTNRLWPGKSPLRIVLGSGIDIRQHRMASSPPETLVVDPGTNLVQAMKDIVMKGIHSVLVEGGAKILKSFLDQDLWDEIITIRSKTKWVEGIKAPSIEREPDRKKFIGEDLWTYYRQTI